MWNAKCENARHVQNNVTIASNRRICQELNCKHLLIVSNLNIIWFNLKTPEFFFSLLWASFLWNVFWSKSLFHFFVVVVYYTFLQELLHSNRAAQKLCRIVVVLAIPRLFFAKLEGSRLEFYFNWAPPGRFLNLLTKENLLGCFH